MALMDHETFRATDSYARLCADYGLDPGLDLDGQRLPVQDCLAFWQMYEGLRRARSPRSAAEVAAQVEALIGRAHLEPGALSLIARYGHLVTVEDETGTSWMITAAPASGEVIAAAMVAAQAQVADLS